MLYYDGKTYPNNCGLVGSLRSSLGCCGEDLAQNWRMGSHFTVNVGPLKVRNTILGLKVKNRVCIS